MRGDWTPLALLAEQCGYTLAKQDADTVIAAPFITCGITEKVNFRAYYTQDRLVVFISLAHLVLQHNHRI